MQSTGTISNSADSLGHWAGKPEGTEENMSKAMEIIRLRRELSDFSKRAFSRGLVSGTGGNVSVRIPGTDQV
jgi:hypothetical protein